MPYTSALFRNGRAVKQEIIKGLEKGTWDWRWKEFSLEKRKMRSWLHGLKYLRRLHKKEGDQVHFRKEKLDLDYSSRDLEGN